MMPLRCVRLAAHDRPVSEARFVDTARGGALGKLGIETIGDLVRHYPFRYLDLTHVGIARRGQSRASTPRSSDGPRGQGQEAAPASDDHRGRDRRRHRRADRRVVQPALHRSSGSRRATAWPSRARSCSTTGSSRFERPSSRSFRRRTPRTRWPASSRCTGRPRGSRPTGSDGWSRPQSTTTPTFPTTCPSALRRAASSFRFTPRCARSTSPTTVDDAEAARHRLAYDELLQLQLYMAMRRHSLTREHAGVAHPLGRTGAQARCARPSRSS